MFTDSLLTFIVIYLIVGSFTGILAGLFGVGGGTIIVPVLIVALTAQQVSPNVLTHIAIGSSLATIAFTAISSIHTHHQHGAVNWRIVRLLSPGVCLGVWLGAAFASQLSGTVLQKFFALFLLLMACHMAFSQQTHSKQEKITLPGQSSMFGAGGVIGLISAFFGIGGGSLTVPFLSWHQIKMQEAVGTAAAVGFPIAVIGALAYAWQGWSVNDLPPWSSGYIYWPACLGLAFSGFWFARLGANMAHNLNPQKLKKIFAAFLALIGLYFLMQ